MFLLTWAALCLFIGVFAALLGRSGFLWFLVSLIFTPLVAIIFLLILGRKKREKVVYVHAPYYPAAQTPPARPIDPLHSQS